MGLYGGRRVCSVCGGPTPCLLPAKVEGMPICKQCSAKVDLPEGAIDQMSLEDFRRYVVFYDGNRSLRSLFAQSYSYSFGLFAGSLSLDVPHRLFRLSCLDTALVFEASNLRAFQISEDGVPLFEGSTEALKCYQSGIPARVGSMGPQLAQFQLELVQYEQTECIRRRQRERYGGSPCSCPRLRPDIDLLKPFRQFRVALLLEHPYWDSFSNAVSAPSFHSDFPSVEDYLSEYHDKVGGLYELARQLMRVLSPDAPEIRGGAEMSAPPALDAADTAQKYID